MKKLFLSMTEADTGASGILSTTGSTGALQKNMFETQCFTKQSGFLNKNPYNDRSAKEFQTCGCVFFSAQGLSNTVVLTDCTATHMNQKKLNEPISDSRVVFCLYESIKPTLVTILSGAVAPWRWWEGWVRRRTRTQSCNHLHHIWHDHLAGTHGFKSLGRNAIWIIFDVNV